MVVIKGYYASICHGLTFIGSLANIVIGVALLGVGLHLSMDFISIPYGFAIPGYIMMVFGFWAMVNGFLGFTGGCKENMKMIRTSLYMSAGQVLFGLVIFGWLLGITKKEEALRLGWKKVSEDARGKIEEKLQCCGYDDTEEGVAGCKSKQTCNGFLFPQYKKRASLGLGVTAAGMCSAALTIFAAGCLSRKMRKEEGKAKKKAFTSLVDEARGIDRSKRPKRPPRSVPRDQNV